MIWPQQQMLLQTLGPLGTPRLRRLQVRSVFYFFNYFFRCFPANIFWLNSRTLVKSIWILFKTDSPRGPRDSRPGWPSGLQRLGNESQKPSNLQTGAVAPSLTEIAFCISSLGWHWSWWHDELEASKLPYELGFCAHTMILYKYWGNSKKRRVKSVHESDVAVVNSWDDLRSFIWSSQICWSYETTLVSTWGSHQDGILSHTAVAQARTWKFVKVKETRWTLKKGWLMGNPRIYMFFTFILHPFTWIIQNIHSEHQQWRWKKMPWGPWVSRCVLAASVFTDGLGSRIRTSAVLAETRFPTGWAWKVGESTATRDVLQDFTPENLSILELGISM